jgi:hypothetical protein
LTCLETLVQVLVAVVQQQLLVVLLVMAALVSLAVGAEEIAPQVQPQILLVMVAQDS